jgi:hypothetical protein
LKFLHERQAGYRESLIILTMLRFGCKRIYPFYALS